jgi:hypothetical protein
VYIPLTHQLEFSNIFLVSKRDPALSWMQRPLMSTGKGVKRTKNNPVFYAELKKGHEIFLTDSSWLKVKELAKKNGLSVSEYIERLIRKLDITVGFSLRRGFHPWAKATRFSTYLLIKILVCNACVLLVVQCGQVLFIGIDDKDG